MAAPYIAPANVTALHSLLNQAQQQLRQGQNTLTQVRNLMVQMIDASDYTVLETQFGFATGKGAAVFSQVDTLYQALLSNASQTAVMDKWNQFLNEIG